MTVRALHYVSPQRAMFAPDDAVTVCGRAVDRRDVKRWKRAPKPLRWTSAERTATCLLCWRSLTARRGRR